MRVLSREDLIAHIRARQAALGGTMSCALRQLSAAYHVANHILDEDWVQSRISIDTHDAFFHDGPSVVPWRSGKRPNSKEAKRLLQSAIKANPDKASQLEHFRQFL